MEKRGKHSAILPQHWELVPQFAAPRPNSPPAASQSTGMPWAEGWSQCPPVWDIDAFTIHQDQAQSSYWPIIDSALNSATLDANLAIQDIEHSAEPVNMIQDITSPFMLPNSSSTTPQAQASFYQVVVSSTIPLNSWLFERLKVKS